MRGLAISILSVAHLATAAVQTERSPVPGETLPVGVLTFGGFTAEFAPDGSSRIEGEGWPTFTGRWQIADDELTLSTTECPEPGRYRYDLVSGRLGLTLVDDTCTPRRMILDGSTWRPRDVEVTVPERELALTQAEDPPPLPEPSSSAASWPSFRGPRASGVADGQNLPDRWDGAAGLNIRWKTPIAGLAHSSPIVWGDRVFVTTAVSSRSDASFRPGLYGDGDASEDRTVHEWKLIALDKRSGAPVWERVARKTAPVGKRHVKSTYASETPATDGRIVVASFGSQGIFAYDIDGNFRWSLDLGHLDLGAYDIPTFEWGTASSPIVWRGTVYVQCDTQLDSFVLALDAETGETRWKADRDELPSWGTPNVYEGPSGPILLTNAPNLLRGYDPETGRELWRLGGSSKITAPTPIFDDELLVLASGRRPEQPIFVVHASARGDLTLPEGKTASDAIAWSRVRRGPYMPTPLIYDGVLYVLANNGVLDAYELASGEELFRARLEHLGSGFSASPVAADGKLYLSNEDGEILVVRASRTFEPIAKNPMGELLMATPALSDGVMVVRSDKSVFAVGRESAAGGGRR